MEELTEETWPSLTGAPESTIKHQVEPDSDEWEYLSSRDTVADKEVKFEENATASPTSTKSVTINPKALHRCMSTPEFSHISADDESYVMDCTSSVDAFSLDDTVLLTQKPTGMKKVPSFKDIIMLNAKEKEMEEEKNRIAFEQQQQQMREEALKRRKNSKPKIVIKQIQRCAKSTGDLRSLVIHEEDEEEYGGGGGGGGGLMDEEVLGDTDAMEFYNRKSKGSQSRSNGRKIRPDEAKRLEISMYKKEAQRQAQREKSS
jgi:hypothetical protein